MDFIGPLLGVIVGAVLTWFQAMHGRRDDRRRDAWAGWAEQAYRLMITRRDLIERCWADQRSAESPPDDFEQRFAQSVGVGLRQEIERDAQLQSSLARVLLAEPSAARRRQARDFTDLLSQDVDQPQAGARALLRSHDQYLRALQATLDVLLGTYAENGTATQVATWFKDKYGRLTDEPIHIIHVDPLERGDADE